jgi:hypothetical protein
MATFSNDAIQIPHGIEELLRNDRALHAGVLLSFAEFAPWLRSSGTPFFPEYTDHGPNHVTEVLESAVSLASDDSHRIMTAGDAATLCLARLLHDAAMHLTEDGFLALSQFRPVLLAILGRGIGTNCGKTSSQRRPGSMARYTATNQKSAYANYCKTPLMRV